MYRIGFNGFTGTMLTRDGEGEDERRGREERKWRERMENK